MAHLVPLATSVFPVAWQLVIQATSSWSALWRIMMYAYALFWIQGTARKGFLETFKGELGAGLEIIRMIRRVLTRRKASPPDVTEAPSESTPAAPEERDKAHRARCPKEPHRVTQEDPERQTRNTR